jgi:5'-nucleotidase
MKPTKIYLFLSLFLLSLSGFAQKEALILHTNDLHSQMEPVKESQLGGMLRLATIVEQERETHPNLFLFDAGDFWMGTPYFNFFGGEIEIAMMNTMKYDAVTIGNHQFDMPLNFLAQRLSEAEFKVVLSNYDVKKTPLKNFVTPSAIIEKNGIKVGVIGVCVDLQGLAMPQNYPGMIYKDPVKTANKLAKKLKKSGCDLVVCLSHLGYKYENAIDDIELAENSKNIDLIIGGHSHTHLKEADVRTNLQGKPVTIVQAGKAGAYLGKVKIMIE